MSGPMTMACYAPDSLERIIATGEVSGDLRAHLDSCESCRELADAIRGNLDFMQGVVGRLGPEPLAMPPRAILEPNLLSGYKLTREIARGGQGVVYEGVQLDTKRAVAVKIIEPGPPGSHATRRIEREAELASSLRHPNIVSVYQHITLPDGRHALAMEYVNGVPMDRWARAVDETAPPTREGWRNALRTKLRTLVTVCEAVQHAHLNGVIHRDLKPANVLISTTGVPRVVDFGVARRLNHQTLITRAGGFAGTLAYASPEQVSGNTGAVDARSDVYSLGMLLYEVLAGRRPYETDGSLSGAINKITIAIPAPLRTIEPGGQPAGADLEAILTKALEKNPAQRYQSAADLARDIQNHLEGRAVEARLGSSFYVFRKLASRHRLPVSVGVATLVVLTVFAGAMAWSSRRLAHQRTLLAASLSSSVIERGRLAATNNDNARAEELIWPELVKTEADVASPSLLFESRPEVTQPAWAITELYSRHPSFLHVKVLPGAESIRFDDDMRAFRVVRRDGAIEVRRMPDGALLSSLSPAIESLAASMVLDTSKRRAVLSTARGVVVRDLETGVTRLLSDPALPALSMDMSPDGTRMIMAGSSGEWTLWGTEPLQRIAVLATAQNVLSIARFSPRGDLISGGVGNQIAVWNASDGSVQASWQLGAEFSGSTVNPVISTVRMSQDQQTVAAAVHNSVVAYARSDVTKPIGSGVAHRGFVRWLDFGGTPPMLLTAGSERNCKVWESAGGNLIVDVGIGVQPRGVPALSIDGRYMGIVNTDDTVQIFETRPGAWLHRLTGAQSSVHAARFSPDNRYVACVASDGAVRIWTTDTNKLAWESPVGGVPLESLAFSADGNSLFVGGQDGAIRRVDLAMPGVDGTPKLTLNTFAKVSARVTSLTRSPDGSTLVAVSAVSTIELIDAATGAMIRTLHGHGNRSIEAAFAPDGKTLYSVGGDGLLIAWDVHTGSKRFEVTAGAARQRTVCASPDGNLIAAGGDDWKIRIWSAKDGRLISTFNGVRNDVFSLAFHPLGNILFSSGRNSTIQVWDVRTGGEVAVLEGHTDLVLNLSISPDGRMLTSASADKSVGVWDLMYYQHHIRNNAAVWSGVTPP